MAITTTCAGCGKTLAVADEYAGRQARCPECGTIYTVPAPISTALDPIKPLAPLGSLGNLADTTGYAQLDAPLDLGGSAYPPASTPTPVPPLAAPISLTETNAYTQQYWMRATNGAEYGPADSAMLARWFEEGRVGVNYQIRQGETGSWLPASMFQPGSAPAKPVSPVASLSGSTNPYAAQSPMAVGGVTPRRYPKPDQSGLVLAMGILAWLGFCPIFGVIGWVVGAQAISDIKSEQADPATLGLVQLGYYLSMVNVVLVIGCVGLLFLFVALGAVVG